MPNDSIEEQFAREHARQLEVYGDALAERLGPPPEAVRMTDDRLVEKYLLRDPAVTPEMIAQMHASGASPEDITRAIHPEREKTYTIGIVGTANQVKEAKRIAALAAKRAQPEPEFGLEALPAPFTQPAPPPPPPMAPMAPETPVAAPEGPPMSTPAPGAY